ncbi:hypothetical protein BDZ85DRAFT_264696 [Elsinoe ampelina]|uniref:Vacuolar sorting protein Vps3844 C-terminal domain-containing protein n=1 Tax=Elsinoe ampelina TaxID=302913 RepID=A0A6A6G9D3_9PEZI|nr:hypothetical protein BDZ85DRAFT_264696 [Elsinoe ampelina]
MRWLSLSLWLPALAAAAQVPTDFNGRLYIYDKSSPSLSNKHAPISHEAARLIIAQRLGVDRYHDGDSISPETMSALNSLGSSSGLFEEKDFRRPLAVLLSSEDRHHHQQDLEPYTHLATVEAIPSLKQSDSLFVGFAAQKYASENRRPVFSKDNAEQGIYFESDDAIVRRITGFPQPGLLLDQYRREGYDVILLISPKQWAAKTSYGHFEWPMVTHDKRQIQEKPLEEEPDTPAPNETISPSKSNDTTPLRGILPFCYSTKEKCESTTRNCTGHGSCKIAYTQKDSSSDDEGVPCYSCSCSATVRENKDGSKKTTVWSGPACQKKDVVTPFWLITGFTVLMIFLVSWAIGTIMTMGNEELPSVIGAGVSGVPRK